MSDFIHNHVKQPCKRHFHLEMFSISYKLKHSFLLCITLLIKILLVLLNFPFVSKNENIDIIIYYFRNNNSTCLGSIGEQKRTLHVKLSRLTFLM